jgi:hypothetical protein
MLAVPAAITWLGLADNSNTAAPVTTQPYVAEVVVNHASVNAQPCTMIWMERMGDNAAPPSGTTPADQDKEVAEVA